MNGLVDEWMDRRLRPGERQNPAAPAAAISLPPARFPRTPRELRRYLAIVPLIADERYYGEVTAKFWGGFQGVGIRQRSWPRTPFQPKQRKTGPKPLNLARLMTKPTVSPCRRRRKESLTQSSLHAYGTRSSETPYVVSYMDLVWTLSLAVLSPVGDARSG
jgi:hypothetical protein